MKIVEQLKEKSWIITLVIIGLLWFQTCNNSRKMSMLKKEMNQNFATMSQKVDSVGYAISTDIKVEGLKSEKRMIQSTDRKILDVNRQSEIDKELELIAKKNQGK